MIPPLAIAVGDPSGVGPAVTVEALASTLGEDRAVVFGDASRLRRAFEARGVTVHEGDAPERGIGIVHVDSWSDAMIDAHAPTPEGGRVQVRILDAAIASVRGGRTRALVTGPTSKEAIVAGGTPFVGQTEHLARAAGLRDDDVTMMFLGPTLRVALVTTHLAVRAACDEVTAPRVARTVRHLAEAIVRLSPSGSIPRIDVAGLNPHAGESGLFGDEELRVVEPTLRSLATEPPFADGRVRLVGPRPAEAVFREAASGRIDGVVAMLHDQATIASKLLDWGSAVNVTWGLPFVRTSVDHGVAYDAARAGTAEAEGMKAAIAMARTLSRAG